jgi:hypothetical protein
VDDPDPTHTVPRDRLALLEAVAEICRYPFGFFRPFRYVHCRTGWSIEQAPKTTGTSASERMSACHRTLNSEEHPKFASPPLIQQAPMADLLAHWRILAGCVSAKMPDLNF